MIGIPGLGTAAAILPQKYDAWGHLTEIKGRKAQNTSFSEVTETFKYDALGRRIQSTTTFSGTMSSNDSAHAGVTNNYHLGDLVVEQTKANANPVTRFVYAPDGQLILRDRDKNVAGVNPFDGTGYPDAVGLEERLYVLFDAAGNTTALVAGGGVYTRTTGLSSTLATAGQVVERFLYDEDGLPTALREDYSAWPAPASPAGTQISSNLSHYSFDQLYHGQQFHLLLEDFPNGSFAGIYEGTNGEFYDPHNGRLIQPNFAAGMTGVNAYDPGFVSDAAADPHGIGKFFGWVSTGAFTLATFGMYTGIGMAGSAFARSALSVAPESLGLARGSLAFGGMALAGAGIGGSIGYASGGSFVKGALIGAEVSTALGSFSPRLSAMAVERSIDAIAQSRGIGRLFPSAARNIASRSPVGRLTNVAALDAPAVGTPSFRRFSQKLADAGYEIRTIKYPWYNDTIARFLPGKVFQYDPSRFKVLHVLHENRHLAQLKRAELLGIDVWKGSDARHLGRLLETEAYGMDLWLGEQFGASSQFLIETKALQNSYWYRVERKLEHSQEFRTLAEKILGYNPTLAR